MPESKAISLVLQVEALQEKGEHVLQAILPCPSLSKRL